ncbi:LuxR C-terminal-related transcriptional regulator [Isosphaeraceae bacterium EP7]
MTDRGPQKRRRSYRPTVETLEAVRLLDAASNLLADLAAERSTVEPNAAYGSSLAGDTSAWDAALGQTRLSDLLGKTTALDQSADVIKGLGQLDRYLTRAWSRAGIAPQKHEDSTQAVYVTLLQTLGRDRFDDLLGEIGHSGIRDVLSRETVEGPDFFRAIDTVKKRAQRERSYQPLDLVESSMVAVAPSPDPDDWSSTIRQAVSKTLTTREADLIDSTMRGETPAEIASRWGVAPKTVSNEKTRAFQKLRDALSADLNG